MNDELSIRFAEIETWVDIPEELLVRMVDVVRAVAQGHESGFLMAEAQHIKLELDKLLVPVVD